MSEEQQSVGAAGDFFPCSSCGAKLHYDATLQAMKCPYCGSQQAMPAAPTGSAREIPIEEGMRLAERGYGTPVKQVGCNECGAVVNVTPGEQTATCTFCKSHQVLAREAAANPIRPESVLPFKVNKDTAANRFDEWLGTLWFRPSDLRKMVKVEGLAGVYIPYWTFDARVFSRWTAQAGYHYYVDEQYTDEQGNRQTRKVQKTRWEPASGQRSDVFDDVIICASKGLPNNMGDEFRSFDTKALAPYNPQFLAGWRAEAYAIDLMPAWDIGRTKMANEQESRCGRDVPGDTYASLQVHNDFQKVTFKHVLLPIWVAAYRYQDKPYQFLVNGQTGEVVGRAPYSIIKIVLFILFILAIIGVIAVATQGKSKRPSRTSLETSPTFTLASEAGRCRLAGHALET